jgi:hypothetical protein
MTILTPKMAIFYFETTVLAPFGHVEIQNPHFGSQNGHLEIEIGVLGAKTGIFR